MSALGYGRQPTSYANFVESIDNTQVRLYTQDMSYQRHSEELIDWYRGMSEVAQRWERRGDVSKAQETRDRRNSGWDRLVRLNLEAAQRVT